MRRVVWALRDKKLWGKKGKRTMDAKLNIAMDRIRSLKMCKKLKSEETKKQ